MKVLLGFFAFCCICSPALPSQKGTEVNCQSLLEAADQAQLHSLIQAYQQLVGLLSIEEQLKLNAQDPFDIKGLSNTESQSVAEGIKAIEKYLHENTSSKTKELFSSEIKNWLLTETKIYTRAKAHIETQIEESKILTASRTFVRLSEPMPDSTLEIDKELPYLVETKDKKIRIHEVLADGSTRLLREVELDQNLRTMKWSMSELGNYFIYTGFYNTNERWPDIGETRNYFVSLNPGYKDFWKKEEKYSDHELQENEKYHYSKQAFYKNVPLISQLFLSEKVKRNLEITIQDNQTLKTELISIPLKPFFNKMKRKDTVEFLTYFKKNKTGNSTSILIISSSGFFEHTPLYFWIYHSQTKTLKPIQIQTANNKPVLWNEIDVQQTADGKFYILNINRDSLYEGGGDHKSHYKQILFNIETLEQKTLFDSDSSPRDFHFSPDSKYLFVVEHEGKGQKISKLDLETGKEQTTTLSLEGTLSLHFDKESKKILIHASENPKEAHIYDLHTMELDQTIDIKANTLLLSKDFALTSDILRPVLVHLNEEKNHKKGL